MLTPPGGFKDGLGLLQAPEGTPPGQVRAATFDTSPEELSWIADQIAQLRARGEVTRWAEVAVLTRRNADIAPLYAELTARDVPVEIVGLGGLLHLPEIMDITATLPTDRGRHGKPGSDQAADWSSLARGPARPGPSGPAGP